MLVARRFILPLAFVSATSGFSASAQEFDPKIYEGFDSVPKIQSLSAVSHYARSPRLRAKWRPIQKVGLDSAAQLMGFFHDRNSLLAARDSALVYYSGVLAMGGRETPNWNLINVSHSGTLSDPHLAEYLAQFGYSAKAAEAGNEFLFFDIAIWSGHSFRTVRSLLPKTHQGAIIGIAISSEYEGAPSMFSALSNMFPQEFSDRLLKSASIERSYRFIQSQFYGRWEYGAIPQFTGNSLQYAKNDQGYWVPISKIDRRGYRTADAPTKSIQDTKEKTIEWMEDLKYFWSEKSTQSEFKWKKELWRNLRTYADENRTSEAAQLLMDHPKLKADPLLRATMAIDFGNLLRHFYSRSAQPLSEVVTTAAQELDLCSRKFLTGPTGAR